MLSLEESKKLQYKHYLDCKAIVERDGNIYSLNSEENERKSYTTLLNALPKTGKFLDVGCQLGLVRNYFPECSCEYDYYGIEILEEVAQMAIEAGVPNVVVGYMESMPYEDSTFDVAWVRHTLEHATDVDKVVEELKRVTKISGAIGVIVPTVKNDEPAHLVQFERDQWLDLFERHGLVTERIWQHDFNLKEMGCVLKKL